MHRKIGHYVDSIKDELITIAKKIYDKPELAFEEFYASEVQANYLESKGFIIEKPYASLETAFKATFKQGKGYPHIAVLSEYDALPNGHACGHNIIAASAVGAALAVKNALETEGINGAISVIGTPAEEQGGGKIIILENHGFEGIDATVMLHPTTGISKVAGRCKSSHYIHVKFHGKIASAISRPEEGINATEASVLTFQSLANVQRYLPKDVQIMPFITSKNQMDYLLPDLSEMTIVITAFEDSSISIATQKTLDVINGVGLITGTRVEINEERGYLGRLINKTIGNQLRKHLINFNEEIMDGFVDDNGFEDFGNVNRVIPGAMIYPTLMKERKISNHTQEFLMLSDSNSGNRVIILGSKVLAATAVDLIRDKELLNAAKEELR